MSNDTFETSTYEDDNEPEVQGFANQAPPPPKSAADNFNVFDLYYIATTKNPFGKKSDGSKWYGD